MATIIYGAVGAGVGAAIGSAIPGLGTAAGAKWGWALGTVVESILNAPKYEQGKLQDRHVSASSYGATIPKVWGRQRIGGNVTWVQTDSTGNHLILHQVAAGGGKGGGTGGSYNDHYWCTFQVAFALGSLYMRDPADPYGGSIADLGLDLVQLYANDQLVYERGNTSTVLQLNSNLFWHPGGETGNQDAIIATAEGASVTQNPGLANVVIQNMDFWPYGNAMPAFVAIIESSDYALADVCAHICGEVGVQSSQLDVSAATSVIIKNTASQIYNGVLVGDAGAPRDTLDGLLSPLLFDFPEVDGVLRLVPRGGSSVMTIDGDDLGATSSDERVARIPRDQPMTIDLPGRVEVNFWNTDSACLQDTASDQRQGLSVNNMQSVDLPLACNFEMAQAIAQQINDVAWIEGESYQIQLPPPYIWLAPGDPVMAPLEDGTLVRMRITEFDMAPIGELKVTLCRDSGLTPAIASAYPSTGVPGGGPRPIAGVAVIPTVFGAWSGTALRAADQGVPVFYVYSAGAAGWPGATLYYSTDGGTSWITAGTNTLSSTFGSATSALSASGAVSGSVDTSNTVGVDLEFGTLVDASAAQVAEGVNAAVLGNEIIGFENATLVSASTYTLSDILRGVNGSPMTGHTSSDAFFMADSTLLAVQLSAGMVGSTVQVVMVGPNETIADVTPVSVVIAPVTASPVQTLAATVGTVVVPTFLATPVTLLSSGTAAAWTTTSLSSDIPAGALFAILDGWVRGTSTGDAELNARSSSSFSSFLRLAKVSLPSGGGPVSQSFQVIVPLSPSLSIDTEILVGFDALELRLIGYWAPA